jgi:CRISPR-associated protein Csm4
MFGHFAWALKYTNGEQRLINWLNNFADTPTLMSDAFPEGFLPKPILRPLTLREGEELFEDLSDRTGASTRVQFFDKLKASKAIRFIRQELFGKVQANLSAKMLQSQLLTETYKLPQSQEELIAHNTISRTTSSVLLGGFYQFTEVFFEPGTRFTFYLSTDDLTGGEIAGVLQFIENSGYGADKSTGKGAVAFDEPEVISLMQFADANGFVTLSSFVPSPNCSTNGCYELFTKYGKLGGDYSNSGNPFKKPLIMMRTGSTFHSPPDGIYGQLLADVHPNSTIRHYAYAFPLGVHLS